MFSEYEELGVKAYYKSRLIGGNEITDININSELNINEVGKYKIYYEVNYKGKHKSISRIVNVMDNESPVIDSLDKIIILKSKSKSKLKESIIQNILKGDALAVSPCF